MRAQSAARMGGRMKKHAKRNGFTLIEMMAVIAIMVVLVGMIVVIAKGSATKADITMTRSQIQRLMKASDDYRLERGVYYGAIGAYVTMQTDVTLTNALNAYLEEDRRVYADPWGNSYFYCRTAKLSAFIYSRGPDGVDQTQAPAAPGTKNDDIRSDRND